MARFPLYIEMEGRKVIIIGGGGVALRKAGILAEFGAHILVVSPLLCDGWQNLHGTEICFCKKRLEKQDFPLLDSAFMVILASDDRELNQSAATYCRRRGIWVDCAASMGDAGSEADSSCIFPSIIKRQNIVIGISSSGGVPALTRHLREKISALVPEWYGDLEKKLRQEREKLKGSSISPAEKREKLREMISQAEAQDAEKKRESGEAAGNRKSEAGRGSRIAEKAGRAKEK